MCDPGAVTKDSRDPRETKFGFTVGDTVVLVGTVSERRVVGFTDERVICGDGDAWSPHRLRHVSLAARPGGVCNTAQARSSEQTMVDMIREDLGVTIDPQAWRMFVRSRFGRLSPLAHRIHEGRS